ncbi:hypothetical protein HD554DRAFT_2022977, partial [Boletus coccyginus]
ELIAQDPDTHGVTFALIVLGSDKMAVSVGTGNTEYYPLYISLENIHNNIHRSHSGTVSVLAFLAISKIKQVIITPRVTRCVNGHFCYIIYGLGPYIADYPKQAMLTYIVQGWCAW